MEVVHLILHLYQILVSRYVMFGFN